jgi:transglutaminase-like putative cysteine protease
MKSNNKFWVKSVVAMCLLMLANIGLCRGDILKAPEPNWITPVGLPEVVGFPQEQVQNGVYYLLLDDQVKVDQGLEPQYYRHSANYIVNQAGVERSSQINIDYDPSYQSLVLHSLRVIRNDALFDKVDSARMKLIQREEDMDELIYNGRMTLNIILDDVRVGDIIEYSYTRQGMNPVYQNIFAYSHDMNWIVPVGRLSLRLLWNKPTPLQSRLERSDLKLVRTETTKGSEYLIQGDHIEPVKIDDNTPSWFTPWGVVYFSELKSWAEVASWGKGLYNNVVVADKNIDRLVADIKLQNSDIEERISAALRFVQDEIRYLGIELGQNSHMPTPAFETLRNRYGDCKDKTVLLLTLLKGLGVQAYPALVNTEEKLEKAIPNIHAFDHVITYIEHDNKRYWVDPTRSYQYGGIDTIHQSDYGYSLVLRSGARGLTQMLPAQSKYGVFVKDTFMLPAKDEVLFSSETTNYGWNAERQRQYLEGKGRDKVQQEYLEFYQRYYPGTTVQEPLEYKNKTRDNILTTTERYRIENFWEDNLDKKRYEADFYANSIASLLNIPDEQSREHPLYLSHPKYLEQVFELNFEEDNWDFGDDSFVEDNDFFRFSSDIKFDKKARQLSLKYTYQSKADHVAPEDYPDYLSALKKVDNEQSYSIYKKYPDDIAFIEAASWSSYLNATSVLVAYGGLYFLVFLLWRMDRRRNADVTDSIFFPVSIVKLFSMWFFTFGLYGAYWFYKNFYYIKEQEKDASMPMARGIFYSFWYYSLWRKLREDCDTRFERSHLISKVLAVPMALVFFVIVAIGDRTNTLLIPSLLLSALLVLPLANYILFVNGSKSQALKKNSEWSLRHYLLALLSIPWCVLSAGSEIGFMPNEAVIKGSRILDYNITLMQRRGTIRPSDEIDYFYSDAFMFVSDDGNGFTKRHVFSYWKNENDSLTQEQATYSEIEDIKIDWKTGSEENSIITIIRKNGSEFLLFVSNIDRKDKLFVNALKERWQSQR